MSAVKVVGWRRPAEEDIATWEPFAEHAAEAGWSVVVEWFDPLEDSNGEMQEGFFSWLLWHEALCSDDKIHGWYMTLPSTPPAEFTWQHHLGLADAGWRAYLERAKVVA